MKRLILCGVLTLAACPRANPAGGGAATGPVTLRTDEDRTLYSLGLLLGDRIQGDFNLTESELRLVHAGMRDKITGARPQVSLDEFGPRIDQLARSRRAARSGAERQRGTQFVERAAAEPGARRLPSGVVYRELQAGSGPQPSVQDRVRVHYRGTLTDGTEFDSSRRAGGAGEPVEFGLMGVVPCWTEGLQQMRVGGRARLVCPPDTAYGDRPQRGIPGGSTLVFEIELLGIPSQAGASGDAATPAPTPSSTAPGGEAARDH